MFNDLQTGSSFEDHELSVGPFSIIGPFDANVPHKFNKVEQGDDPFGHSIDGTTFLSAHTNLDDPVRLSFHTPILAWGADFRNIADSGRQTAMRFLDSNDDVIAAFQLSGFDAEQRVFLGVDLDGLTATALELHYVGGAFSSNAFGIDNVVMTARRDSTMPAPVPLPASSVLLFGGLCALRVLRRKI